MHSQYSSAHQNYPFGLILKTGASLVRTIHCLAPAQSARRQAVGRRHNPPCSSHSTAFLEKESTARVVPPYTDCGQSPRSRREKNDHRLSGSGVAEENDHTSKLLHITPNYNRLRTVNRLSSCAMCSGVSMACTATLLQSDGK